MLRAIAVSAVPTGVGNSAIYAVLGYLVVFIGLVLLMAVIVLMGRIMASRTAKASAKAPAPAQPAKAQPAPAQASAPAAPPAPGAAGEVRLHDVPDREAALIMAIVAEKMGRPLNELRFKSIREVKP